MAETLKILGQQAPSATTWANLYTVPPSASAVVSTIAITNYGADPTLFNIGCIPAATGSNTPASNAQYLVFQSPINPGETIFLTVGGTLAASDRFSCYNTLANCAFTAFGSEIT